MWTAFEIGINLIQAFMMLMFMKSRLSIVRQEKYWDALCVAAITLFLSLYQFVDMPFPDSLVFMIPFVYALWAANDKWYVSAFWVLVLTILFLLTVSLSLHIFMAMPTISYDSLMEDTVGRVFFVAVTNLILFLILYSTSKLKREYSTLAWPTLLLFLLMNVSLLVVEESLFALQMELEIRYSIINEHPFFVTYICLCLSTFFSIFLFHIMSQSAARENRYKTEASTMALSTQYQQELEQIYSNLRVQKHDFQQHYQTLEEMVRLGGSQEAKEYLASYHKAIAGQRLFITGCTAVDALLTAKYLTMQKHGFLFKYSAYPLDNLPITEIDFCAIIGNLLDNAIEGTQRVICNEKSPLEIQLTFSRSWNMFYIFCSNPCNILTIQRDKNSWRSSKDREGISGLHAIGIHNIERIVNAAEGRCTFDIQNHVFYAKVVLPYPFEERTDNND